MIRCKRSARWASLLVLAAAGWLTSAADAGIVTPKMGGGQLTASMKHADVSFDGTSITVHLDDTVATPDLVPLTSPDYFDPTQPWAVLGTMDYNYQLAWNPGGFITLPVVNGVTGAIWVERISASPGLHAFLRPPMYTTALGSYWPEVLATDGTRWKWSGAIQHNAYAIQDPLGGTYNATYKVYIGDPTTGDPWAGFNSDTTTWTWNAAPEPASLALLGLGAVALRLRGRKHR
jgi:hypothetical protein